MYLKWLLGSFSVNSLLFFDTYFLKTLDMSDKRKKIGIKVTVVIL